MRILHTSDWHLGRQFHGQSLESDHTEILRQVIQAMHDYEPDVLIIAGDIFDRAIPPTIAVRQFNDFIKTIAADTSAAIVLIAGNHDSGDRIESMSIMTDQNRVLIRGPLAIDERPLVLKDESGLVAFSALPFGYEFAARECFSDDTIGTPEDVLRVQIDAARKHVPEGARWVITAHSFVTGGKSSESERSLGRAVGGIETVTVGLFEGANYVALGHLHKPQSVTHKHIRYSGSPLAFGYDEADASKSMSLVDLAADGSVNTSEIPFKPLRGIRVLRGKLADLIASGTPSKDFVKVILTDEVSLIDPMKKIRGLYPNATLLSYERDETFIETKSTATVQAALQYPKDVISEFLRHVRGDTARDEESRVIDRSLKELETEGGANATD